MYLDYIFYCQPCKKKNIKIKELEIYKPKEIINSKFLELKFDNLDNFKEIYIKCQLFHLIYFEKSMTLSKYLLFIYNKSKKFTETEDYSIPEIPDSGNVIDYFMNYKIESLLACGI